MPKEVKGNNHSLCTQPELWNGDVFSNEAKYETKDMEEHISDCPYHYHLALEKATYLKNFSSDIESLLAILGDDFFLAKEDERLQQYGVYQSWIEESGRLGTVVVKDRGRELLRATISNNWRCETKTQISPLTMELEIWNLRDARFEKDVLLGVLPLDDLFDSEEEQLIDLPHNQSISIRISSNDHENYFIQLDCIPAKNDISSNNKSLYRLSQTWSQCTPPSKSIQKPLAKPEQAMLNFFIEEATVTDVRIKIIGIGGGGGNAIDHMIEAGVQGAEFIAANTDMQALLKNKARNKIQLGSQLTKGLGAGANPEIGRDAALEDVERIVEALNGADIVFITTGLGGGTGTGAAPVIGAIAKELGILTVAVVTKPFTFEGSRRIRQAEEGILELRGSVDTIITIPNDRLELIDNNIGFTEAFKQADDVLLHAIQAISDLITVPGMINLDFSDVKSVMVDMGVALMGVGYARGEGRALEAMKTAIESRLLEENSIKGAQGVLVNITCGRDMTLREIREAVSLVSNEAADDANIIFGVAIDENMLDEVKITVIATGFQKVDSVKDVTNIQQYLQQRVGSFQNIEQRLAESHRTVDSDTQYYPLRKVNGLMEAIK